MPNKTFVVDTGALVLRAIALEIRCLCDLIWISQIVDPDACGSNCCFYQCELLLPLLQGSSQTSDQQAGLRKRSKMRSITKEDYEDLKDHVLQKLKEM